MKYANDEDFASLKNLDLSFVLNTNEQTGKYTVSVFRREKTMYDVRDCLGTITWFNARWLIQNDPTFESPRLIVAIKKLVSNYDKVYTEFREIENGICFDKAEE